LETEGKTSQGKLISNLLKNQPTISTNRIDIAFTGDTGQGTGQQTPLLVNHFPEKKY